jgi:putative sugar O-methyltransferase
MAECADLQEVVRLLRKRFKDDPRYYPDRVVDGFAARRDPDPDEDDSPLLNRICSAYIKSTERQQAASPAFSPTQWWRRISEKSLGPVVRALSKRDIDALRSMYRNFFRDPCSTGLVGLPVDMQKRFFGDHIRSFYRELFLGDALHRIDLWKSWTGNQFPLTALAAPEIGNPYGISIDGVLIRIAAEYQHFYALEIASLLRTEETGTVMEIGGGFGGMAYYLIRDCPGVKYINFDVPETIALASYYLLKSFPKLKATLYGEAPGDSDIVLMPSCELPRMDDYSVNVSFTSNVLRDMSAPVACEYIHHIARVTRSHILNIDSFETLRLFSEHLSRQAKPFKLTRTRRVFWNSARALQSDELECLFSV